MFYKTLLIHNLKCQVNIQTLERKGPIMHWHHFLHIQPAIYSLYTLFTLFQDCISKRSLVSATTVSPVGWHQMKLKPQA